MSEDILEVRVEGATVPSSTAANAGAWENCPSVSQPTTCFCEVCGVVFGSEEVCRLGGFVQ